MATNFEFKGTVSNVQKKEIPKKDGGTFIFVEFSISDNASEYPSSIRMKVINSKIIELASKLEGKLCNVSFSNKINTWETAKGTQYANDVVCFKIAELQEKPFIDLSANQNIQVLENKKTNFAKSEIEVADDLPF